MYFLSWLRAACIVVTYLYAPARIDISQLHYTEVAALPQDQNIWLRGLCIVTALHLITSCLSLHWSSSLTSGSEYLPQRTSCHHHISFSSHTHRTHTHHCCTVCTHSTTSSLVTWLSHIATAITSVRPLSPSCATFICSRHLSPYLVIPLWCQYWDPYHFIQAIHKVRMEKPVTDFWSTFIIIFLVEAI